MTEPRFGRWVCKLNTYTRSPAWLLSHPRHLCHHRVLSNFPRIFLLLFHWEEFLNPMCHWKPIKGPLNGIFKLSTSATEELYPPLVAWDDISTLLRFWPPADPADPADVPAGREAAGGVSAWNCLPALAWQAPADRSLGGMNPQVKDVSPSPIFKLPQESSGRSTRMSTETIRCCRLILDSIWAVCASTSLSFPSPHRILS